MVTNDEIFYDMQTKTEIIFNLLQINGPMDITQIYYYLSDFEGFSTQSIDEIILQLRKQRKITLNEFKVEVVKNKRPRV